MNTLNITVILYHQAWHVPEERGVARSSNPVVDLGLFFCVGGTEDSLLESLFAVRSIPCLSLTDVGIWAVLFRTGIELAINLHRIS